MERDRMMAAAIESAGELATHVTLTTTRSTGGLGANERRLHGGQRCLVVSAH